MKLLLAVAFIFTASFVYAQNTAKQPVTTKDSTVYRVKPSPNPTIYIGTNILGGIQTKDTILENPCLSIASTEWSILSYKVTFVRMKGNSNGGVEDPPIMVRGACFTDEVIAKIQSYPPRTVVEFTDIKIQSKAEIRTVNMTLMIRIK